MSDSSWQQIKRVFSEALALPPGQRMAFLDASCPDEEMRTEVLSLLSFYDEDPEFLESAVDGEAFRAVELQERSRLAAQLIGPYQLDRELGRGGMGTVYLAHREDGQFEHKVAIKLGKHDALDQEMLERLKHERQILASLHHANIARLLDGGVTENSRPYFAMEYVEGGQPIDVYCSATQATVEERLRLFQQVCDAVAYAHRKLVVHRDLKPSNILVSPAGVVKLLDFGVAKLLDDSQSFTSPVTRTGLRIMTPEYASPEQVRGEEITTACDVYALGVILYELLAGRRPYDVRDLSPTQVEHVICDAAPPLPSTALQQQAGADSLYREVQGDLDNIVMKALRKEPVERYGSVELLREDIERYLDQMPVMARPATVRYRVAKFVKRHRMGVLALVVVLLALIGGIISTAYQATVASRAREVAEARAGDVREMANTLLFDIHDAIRDLPGATPARRLLVKNAEAYLGDLSADLKADPALRLNLAEAYKRVGEIQGDPHFPNLGDLQGAQSYYEKAVQLREQIYASDSSLANAWALSLAQGRLAVVLSWGGSNEKAIALSHAALALLEKLYAISTLGPSEQIDIRHDLGRMRSELGWWYVFAGQMDEAKLHLAAAREHLEAVAGHKAGEVDFEIDLWRVYNYQVDAYRWSGAPELAMDILQHLACNKLEALRREQAFNPRIQSSLRTCYNKLGDLYKEAAGDPPEPGQMDKAIAYYEAALDLARQLAASDSTNMIGLKGVAGLEGALGLAYEAVDNHTRAQRYFESALVRKRDLYAQDMTNGEMGNTLGNTLRAMCGFYLERQQYDAALEKCEEARGLFNRIIAADPLNGIWRSNLVETYLLMGDVFTARLERAGAAEVRATYRREAMLWYDEGIGLIEHMDAEGVSFNWATKLDSLQALRDSLAP